MSRLFRSIAIALCLFVAGCWSDSPSESSAKQVFENLLKQKYPGVAYRVTSFVKKNGQERQVHGVRVYIMSVEVAIQFPNGVHPECLPHQRGQTFSTQCGMMQIRGIQFHPAGANVSANEEFVFEKTERGWRGLDGRLY